MSDLVWRVHSLVCRADLRFECEVCGRSWLNPPADLCPGARIYPNGWNEWPEGLLTKKQLSDAGYTTGKKLPAPAGLIPRADSPDGYMRLYDPAAATPKREMSVAQVAALVKAWEVNEQRNSCPECGARLYGREWYRRICGYCEIRQWHAEAMAECRTWARRQLELGFVVIDFETTGLGYDAEPVQVGIVDHLGAVLVDTLIKPVNAVSEGARSVHGISDERLADAPTWGEIYPAVFQAVQGKTVLYYAMEGFDVHVFYWACRLYHLPMPLVRWESVQPLWNGWCGEWHGYFEDWRWQPLGGSHDAARDAEAVRCLVRKMAGLP